MEKNMRNKKVSFTHSELKKLVAKWDKGYATTSYERKIVINHLMECKSCEKMLLRKHVVVEIIKR